MSNVFIERDGEIIIEHGQILYRNFSGIGSQYNREGDRNFNVIIDDPEIAQRLQEEGWNVKCRVPRDPDDSPTHHLKVNVNFGSRRPPEIYIHTGSNIRTLNEETVKELDHMDIVDCSMIITPYHYKGNSGDGISGYLKSLRVVIREDRLAHIYDDLENEVA